MVGIPIDLIISDYTLSVEMKIIEGVAILSLNVSKLIYNNTFLKSYVSKKWYKNTSIRNFAFL